MKSIVAARFLVASQYLVQRVVKNLVIRASKALALIINRRLALASKRLVAPNSYAYDVCAFYFYFSSPKVCASQPSIRSGSCTLVRSSARMKLAVWFLSALTASNVSTRAPSKRRSNQTPRGLISRAKSRNAKISIRFFS